MKNKTPDIGPRQVTRDTKGLGNNPKTEAKVHETGLCLVRTTSARVIAWE